MRLNDVKVSGRHFDEINTFGWEKNKRPGRDFGKRLHCSYERMRTLKAHFKFQAHNERNTCWARETLREMYDDNFRPFDLF